MKFTHYKTSNFLFTITADLNSVLSVSNNMSWKKKRNKKVTLKVLN